jgi:hypothetical protein
MEHFLDYNYLFHVQPKSSKLCNISNFLGLFGECFGKVLAKNEVAFSLP